MESSFTLEETASLFSLAIAEMPSILLVDDDPLALERLSGIFRDAGFEVLTAQSGEGALASLRARFTPIVILDRDMPGMSGVETCKRIRELKLPGYVYLIIWTIQDSDEEVVTGLQAGADEYLSKRTSSAQLIARIRGAQRILSLEHALKHMVAVRRHMSETDALTGMYNRRFFMKQGERCVRRAKRMGRSLALLALDIDHFKSINDTFGHGVGDEVLIGCAKRMAALLSSAEGWCARTGGEEFVVVLEDCDLTRAQQTAERLRAAIEQPLLSVQDFNIPVTVSIGVSGLESGVQTSDLTIDSLLREADRCLYRSKTNGRNRVTVAGGFVRAVREGRE